MPTSTDPNLQRADRLARTVTRLAAARPGDRSALRHSLGKPPHLVPAAVHRIVVPYLPADAGLAAERAYYAVAAMIAAQSRSARDQADDTDSDASTDVAEAAPQARRQDLGVSIARVDHAGNGNLEARLHLLARQDLDGIHRHLPRIVARVRASQVPVDWGLLIQDLTRWPSSHRVIAKRWLQNYYRTRDQLTSAPNGGQTEE